MEYIAGPRQEGCFLCEASDYVLTIRERVLAVLNKYPYNTGHIVVAPRRHIADLADLDDEEHLALSHLVTDAVGALRAEATPSGFNIGINLGEVSGAGLPGHLHVHVVPRWAGDTNFMPVIAETKILPESLEDTLAKLKPRFT